MNRNIKIEYIKHIGWLGLSKLITQIGTWIGTIFIARILSPSDYGLVGMAGLICGFIMLVGDFGLGTSIIQKKNISEGELSSLFFVITIIGIIISFFIYLIAPLGGLFFKEDEVTFLIKLSSLSFFFNSIGQVPKCLLQKQMKFKQYGMVQSTASIISCIFIIILAYKGFGALSLVLGTIINSLIITVLSFYVSKFRPNYHLFSFNNLKSHLDFGYKITLQSYCWYYFSNIDFLIAGKMLGKVSYGAYSLAFQLVSMPIEKLVSIINPVSLPAFSSIKSRSELISFYFLKVRYLSFIITPIFFGFFWSADDMIIVLLSEKWEDSIYVFKVLSIICIFRCLSTINTPLLNAIRRPDVGLKNMIVGSIVATITFLLYVKMGINGLAYAWLTFFPILFVYFIYNVSKAVNFKMKDYFSNIKIPFINALLMSTIIFLFQLYFDNYIIFSELSNLKLIRGISTIMIGILSYVFFAFTFDKQLILGLFNFFKNNKTTN